ncbi:MAG: SRPBCC family protein [Planctomycetota bacterium]
MDETSRASASPTQRARYALALLFGTTLEVRRRPYVIAGLSLAIVKYGVEAAVIWLLAGHALTPLEFVSPVLKGREQLLAGGPTWLSWALFVWTIPFLWIAFTMSVRRAANAFASPWMGLLVLVPCINLLLMARLCFASANRNLTWRDPSRAVEELHQIRSAAIAVGLCTLLGLTMTALATHVVQLYGSSLFLATPTAMGAISAYAYNRQRSRSCGSTLLVALLSVTLAGLSLLLFAVEGLICLVMAAPLALPLGALGGCIGKAVADRSEPSRPGALFPIFCLPLLVGAEAAFVASREREVLTAVEINAPPATVWAHVVSFPSLPEPTEFLFRVGIACPQSARIDGEGVGAIRYCVFSTGEFVEPITVWEPAVRLGFDVVSQPAPMFELSPYHDLHPPHLDGALMSRRGEFRLVPLSNGRTRLEGRTWYVLELFPLAYWSLWSDAIIHRIHERVLRHVQRLAES